MARITRKIIVAVDRPEDEEEYGQATLTIKREDGTLLFDGVVNSLMLQRVSVVIYAGPFGRIPENGLEIIL